jgi:hypothetical protein
LLNLPFTEARLGGFWYLGSCHWSKLLPPLEPTMRQERTVQASIFDFFATHEIGYELKAMSLWLDEHRNLLGLVARDLRLSVPE